MREPTPPLSAPVPLTRRDALAAVVLASMLALGALGRIHSDVCGQCHDDGIYVVNAKALAEGDGYRLTNLPGEPPQTKYPPLYASALALLWKLGPAFPDNLPLLQGFSLLCGCAFLASAFLYLVRFSHASRGVAFSAGALCAVHPSFVFFCVVTMSEMFFALLLVAMLWWLESALRRPETPRMTDFLGGLLLALPFLCRSIGLLFIPLGLLLLWQRGRRWRWASVGALAAVLPWLLWSLAAARECAKDPVQGYYTDYLGWWSAHGIPALSKVVGHNLVLTTTSIGSGVIGGLSSPLLSGGRPMVWLALTAPLGLIALSVLGHDIRKGRALATILAAYLVLVCAWPWAPQRFVMPILPFLAVYLLRGLMLPGKLPAFERAWPHVARLGLALFLGAGIVEQAGVIRLRHQEDTPTPEQGSRLHSWPRMRRTLDWLQANSHPDDVIAAGADPAIYLYTGRKAYYPIVCPPLSLFYGYEYPEEEVYAGSLRGLDHYRPRYLVLTPNFHGEDEFRAWVDLLQERTPGMLECVYRDEDDPRFTIYEIHYPHSSSSRP